MSKHTPGPMAAEQAFEHGREIGLNALDAAGAIFDGPHEASTPQAYVGMLTTIMACIYAHAPDTATADSLINLAQQWAKEATGEDK